MGRAAEVARQIGWYWGTLMGDNHYRRYVEHRGRTHPDEPVVSEREYWRMRHDATESNPQPPLLLTLTTFIAVSVERQLSPYSGLIP